MLHWKTETKPSIFKNYLSCGFEYKDHGGCGNLISKQGFLKMFEGHWLPTQVQYSHFLWSCFDVSHLTIFTSLSSWWRSLRPHGLIFHHTGLGQPRSLGIKAAFSLSFSDCLTRIQSGVNFLHSHLLLLLSKSFIWERVNNILELIFTFSLITNAT